MAVRIQEGEVNLWALRADEPDKNVAGRSWTTEVAIGQTGNEVPRLSLRLLVHTFENAFDVDPAVPGLLLQIAKNVGLSDELSLNIGIGKIASDPWYADSDDDIDKLICLITDRTRKRPVVVATGDERDRDPENTLFKLDQFSRLTLGLAYSVAVPAELTYALSEAFGKMRSVYHGGVRVYMPGFDSASDPYEHTLFLSEQVRRSPEKVLAHLRRLVATESLRRTKLGFEILPFAAVRSVSLRIEQELAAKRGASDSELLSSANRRIEALEAELEGSREQAVESMRVAIGEEERAKGAEAQLFGARARIQQLEAQLKSRGQDIDADVQLPTSWDLFADWCDQALIGRVVLAPAVRSKIKKAEFGDVALAARCMLWLAGTCRDRRMHGGGSIANIPIEQGIENAPCGADTFDFDFHGSRLEADWHVKSGGNTRDPSRCLRIYYAWEEIKQQIIVADMPAHRRTGAT